MSDQEQIIGLLKAQKALLQHIAKRLDALADAKAQLSPNYRRRLAEYKDFEWGSIGAKVVASTKQGAIEVEYAGHRFDRRMGEKFNGAFIIFSRPAGKNGDAQMYHTLVRFADYNETPLDPPAVRYPAQPAKAEPSTETAPARTEDSPTAYWRLATILIEAGQCDHEQAGAIASAADGTWAEKATKLIWKHGPLPQ
jgi:hypothetical protein